MLTIYKNRFVEIISEWEIDPAAFEAGGVTAGDGDQIFTIRLKSTPLQFLITTSKDSYHDHKYQFVAFAPTFPVRHWMPHEGWTTIDQICGVFSDWIHDHIILYIEETEAQDHWALMAGERLLSADPLMDRESQKFSEVEKERIQASLQTFRESVVAEFQPSAEQIDVIYDRLNYLLEAVDRLNKTDWRGVALNTVISISMVLSLDTERGKQLFALFRRAFTSVLEFFK